MSQTIPSQTDVLVIGGGPAGSLASGLLSKKGFDVVLLEKARHPRAAVGESAIPHFWRYTDMLGATEKIDAAGFVRKAGAIVYWDGEARRLGFKDYGYDKPALHLDRDVFDKILLDTSVECGTQVFERTMVTRVEMSDDTTSSTVHYKRLEGSSKGEEGQIEARFVIDASGQSAIVAKQFGVREFDQQLRNTAMWGYFRKGRYLDYEGQLRPFEQRFETSPATFLTSFEGGSWTWQIVLRDKVSIGVVMPIAQMKELKASGGTLEERYRRTVREVPGLCNLQDDDAFIDGSVTALRDYAYKPTELTIGNCYLVGDAASFVDPINSAGLTFAMYSAYLATWAIETSLNKPKKIDYCRRLYASQYRRRLHIFRLVSVPGDAPLEDAEWKELVSSFKLYSEAEQQLALGTTVLTCRPERVRRLMDELGIKSRELLTTIQIADGVL